MSQDEKNTTYVWHCIWSHWRNPHGEIDYESSDTCDFRPKSEVTEILFTGHKERAANLLVIIHYDVCSPIKVIASSGFVYLLK